MKKFLLTLCLCVSVASRVAAQTTLVTGQVTDPNGVPYAFGRLTAGLVNANGVTFTTPATVTIASSATCQAAGLGPAPCQAPFPTSTGPYALDASGNIPLGGITLEDNSLVTPGGTLWRMCINTGGIPSPGGTGPQTFCVNISVSGASQNVGATLSALAPVLSRIPTIVTFKNLNTLRFADQFAGGDCGAKINAADLDLGSAPGEIWVNQNCGLTISTSVSIGAGASNYHILRFIQGGTWLLSAILHVSSVGSAIVCTPQAVGGAGGIKLGPVTLQQANASNLAEVVSLDAGETGIYNCIIDGNKTNNTATIGVLVNKANRVAFAGDTFQNAPSHGVKFLSTGTNKESCCAHMEQNMYISNGGDGIFSVGSSDIFLSNSEIENNGVNGIELSDSPTWRLSQLDIGGNGSAGGTCSTAGVAGLCIYGTAAGLKSYGTQLTNINFGNQYQDDWKTICYDTVGGAATCGSFTPSSLFFLGSTNRTPNNTYNAIEFVDSGGGTSFSSIFISPGTAPNVAKYGYTATETAAGRAVANQIAGIAFSQLAFGTAQYSDTTQNGTLGLQVPHRGGGSTSATFDLFDITTGAAAPHKFLRVSGGNLQFLNSAGNTVISTLTDAGLFQPLANAIPAVTNSTGLQVFNTTTTCTTAASAGATCTTAAISLPVAEPDTSYRVVCTGKGPTNVPVVITTANSSVSQFTITIAALTAATATFGSYDCVAGHN